MAEPESTEDDLGRRLNYGVLAAGIACSLATAVFYVVCVDEVLGGTMKQDLEKTWDAVKQWWHEREVFEISWRRVNFETWLALNEGADND